VNSILVMVREMNDTGLMKNDTGLMKNDTGLMKNDTGLMKNDTGLMKNDSQRLVAVMNGAAQQLSGEVAVAVSDKSSNTYLSQAR